MEVVADVIETCDKEAGQKILLKGRAVMFTWICWWTIWRIWIQHRVRNA